MRGLRHAPRSAGGEVGGAQRRHHVHRGIQGFAQHRFPFGGSHSIRHQVPIRFARQPAFQLPVPRQLRELVLQVGGAVAGSRKQDEIHAAQYAAMLVVGLLGASAFDRWRADRAMIGSKYFSAVLALLPVAGFYVWGISIPLLVISVMGLAGMRMVFTPALQSAVPVLVKDREALQAINGLFDATWRLARLIGPMLAAVLNTLLPVIHFLSVTAVGFVL